MTDTNDAAIRHIYERWHETIRTRDIDGLMALYAEDAIFETPLVVVALPGRSHGVLKGSAEIRSFFTGNAGLSKLPGGLARWYRTGTFFANGRQLVWEYPRAAPDGDQIDLVEVMDIADGLIVHHRVYWGWVGFKALVAAMDQPKA
ncbi:MAG: nuclear transport factor 2 family protein [Rhizobiales bacterium]|nr:nuclear transport factor 2 family protein [Hyphomicrobiales bacterium]